MPVHASVVAVARSAWHKLLNDRFGMIEPMSPDDADPVRRLLSIGPPGASDPADWPDYAAAYGLGCEHITALTGLVCDVDLHRDDTDGDQAWAPMHALRALGQLRAAEAVMPILDFLNAAGDDAVTVEEFPLVLSLIGPAAIPAIAEFMSGQSNTTSPVIGAMQGVSKIALRHPECRGECVAILTGMLRHNTDPRGTINGFAMWNLIDLAAVEAMDPIREAFQRNAVDLSIVGDEEDVEIALGLRTHRATSRPDFRILPPDRLEGSEADNAEVPRRIVKVGRNAPCPCGSGKKYKKCCLQ
jgi:hypothetical protein